MKARALCVSTVLLALASASRAHAADPDVPPDASYSAPRVTLYASAGGGSVLDKAGGPAPSAPGSVRLGLPLARFFALEVSGTSGYAAGRGTPDDLWLRLALGLRIEDAHQALRPYGA